MRKTLTSVFVAVFLLPVHASIAQELTGTLIGTVKDAQGGVLPGAVVRVSSPALIGGAKTLTTDERGHFRFPSLPTGPYTIDIEMTGFKAYHEEDLRIGVGATMERTPVLALAGVQQSVEVPAAGSRLEARGSGFGTSFGPEDLEKIPTRRFAFDFPKAAPGISPTSPASVSNSSMSAFGSGTNENMFLIDGTNFTCPCSGEARSEPGVDFIREVNVQSVGASAEFGNLQGAVVNIVTRQGGANLQFDAAYHYQTGALTSQPVRLVYPGPGQRTSGYERVKYRDATTSLGGPVVRDRLWFFAGYQHLRDYDSQPGTDPTLPRTYEQDKIFAKLTWRLSPSLQLVNSFHDEFWVNPELPTLVKPVEATQRLHASVPASTFGHLTHTLSSNTVWDVRVGRFVFDRKDDPSTGDVNRVGRLDLVTNVASGAPQTFGSLLLIRTTAKATVNRYHPRRFGADHQWRFGGQVEKGEHQLSTIIPTGVRYEDRNSAPSQSVSSAPSNVGGVFVTASGFVSDAITVGDSLTINAGVRFDHSRAISQDLATIDAERRETTEVVQGSGTFYTWNEWSPRLGVTIKLDADGRTMLRASYGRFTQGVLTGELSPFHPGASTTTTRRYNATTGGYTDTVSTVDPRRNLELDSEIQAPRTDQYSIGLDREIGRRLAVAVAYIRKTGSEFIAWTDIGGAYQEKTVVAGGKSLQVFEVANTADRLFLLTNPEGYALEYNGLVMAVEKRRSHGWQAFGSYTLSRTSGLQVTSGSAASTSQVSTIASQRYLTFGQDPNTLTNARGRLPNDRPHMFRIMGSLDVPRTGFVVAGNLQHFSGKPWAATAQVELRQGNQRILLEAPGTRRLSSQTLLDLRVSRTIGLGKSKRIEVLVDILNVLNDTAEERLATDTRVSPNFGVPVAFIDPRRAMIGVKLNLGR